MENTIRHGLSVAMAVFDTLRKAEDPLLKKALTFSSGFYVDFAGPDDAIKALREMEVKED